MINVHPFFCDVMFVFKDIINKQTKNTSAFLAVLNYGNIFLYEERATEDQTSFLFLSTLFWHNLSSEQKQDIYVEPIK